MITHTSVRCGGMTHTTRVLRWISIGFSAEIGRKEEGMGKPSMSEKVSMELSYGNESVNCLWVRVWGNTNK